MFKAACAAPAALTLGACGATIAGELVASAGTSTKRFASCLAVNGFIAKSEDLSFRLIRDRLTHGIIAARYESEGLGKDLPDTAYFSKDLDAPAFLDDAALSLLVPPTVSQGDPNFRDTGRGWSAWQVRLAASCDTLESIAGDEKISCLPIVAEMADFLPAQYPDHPMLQAPRNKVRDDAIKKASATANSG